MSRLLPAEKDDDDSSSEHSESVTSVQMISETRYSSSTRRYASQEEEADPMGGQMSTSHSSTPRDLIETNDASAPTLGKPKGKKRKRDDDAEEGHESPEPRDCDGCPWCQLAAFKDAQKYPITITNDTGDDEPLPENFTFIEKPIYREGVEPADDAFRAGCECREQGGCELRGCSCVEDVYRVPGTKVAAHQMQYTLPPAQPDLLKAAFLDQKQPIYECNEKCACGPSCRNRVVERGRKVPLDIFRTDDGRGWGLRCTENLSRGQFIDLYIGEVITAEEAGRRRKASNSAKQVYLFALDKFTDPLSYDERLRGPTLEVDGEHYAGPTRFMNHSCNPNTRVFARVADHANKHVHDLAFFAIKNIPRYTELTFDYLNGFDGEPDEDEEGHTQMCLCGERNCRGWVW